MPNLPNADSGKNGKLNGNGAWKVLLSVLGGVIILGGVVFTYTVTYVKVETAYEKTVANEGNITELREFKVRTEEQYKTILSELQKLNRKLEQVENPPGGSSQ